jgi:pimeloyl-ACP methyl ester carboxylesterase
MTEFWDSSPSSSSPKWFREALASPREEGQLFDGEAEIEYLRWRPSKELAEHAQGIIFVHGAGASAWWWSFIAPSFRELGYDCVSLSCSGCGRSGTKAQYSARVFVDEILFVSRTLGLFSRPNKPFIVSHSFGSVTALLLALTCGELFQGMILTDVRVGDTSFAESEQQRVISKASRQADRRFVQRDKWIVHPPSPPPREKFKLAPFQECTQPFVFDFIANTSAVKAENGAGWTWTGDPDRFRKLSLFVDTPYMILDEIKKALEKVPMAFLFGTESFFFDMPRMRETVLGGKLGALVPVSYIKGARHHLLLDEPAAFIAAVQAYLQMWTGHRALWENSNRRSAKL